MASASHRREANENTPLIDAELGPSAEETDGSPGRFNARVESVISMGRAGTEKNYEDSKERGQGPTWHIRW